MRILIVIFALLVNFNFFAQSGKIDSYINKLDNSQFKIAHGSAATFSVNSPAAFKLIKKGKRAEKKLVAALSDSTKAIMAHWILCHIQFKTVSFAGPKTVFTSNGNLLKYYLGEEKGEGLIISENESHYLFVELKDLEKIKNYWTKKMKG